MQNKRFVKNDEGFVCAHCGKQVPPLVTTSRDHCPICLYSLHVDINPGDRLNHCYGLLIPHAIEINSKKGYVIIYQCERCGVKIKNKAAMDDSVDKIIEISVQKQI